jgi:Ca2+-binding RTX toxin-like protein
LVSLEGGADRWTAGDEDEFVDGGAGKDTLDLASKGAVDLNLSQELVTSGALKGSKFSNFETVIGSMSSSNVLIGNSSGNRLVGGTKVDFIRGGSGNDSIQGGADDDTLDGGKDNDILYGDAGNDALFGDLGVDQYYGGAGADRFALGGNYAVDGKVDKIRDFSAAQKDRIDLFDIDANSVLAGNQKFSFIGTSAFTNKAGELRYVTTSTADVFQVLGDTNGDGIANFIVEVTVVGSFTSFVAADFIL